MAKVYWVTKLDSAVSSKDTEYMKATLKNEDGKEQTFNVFDEAMKTTIDTAYTQKLGLECTFEKSGRFFNLKEVKPIAQKLEEKPKEESPVERAPRQDIYLTDQQIRDRSMALAYAKDLAVAGKIETKDILKTADMYRQYIEGEIVIK